MKFASVGSFLVKRKPYTNLLLSGSFHCQRNKIRGHRAETSVLILVSQVFFTDSFFVSSAGLSSFSRDQQSFPEDFLLLEMV